MLAADKDKKDEKINDIAREICRINTTIRTRRRKGRERRKLSLRLNEIKII